MANKINLIRGVLLANGDELNFNLPKFARPLLGLQLGFLAPPLILLEENGQYFFLYVTSSLQNETSLDTCLKGII